MAARGHINRWKRSVEGFGDFFGCARRPQDELVSGKDVGVGNVANVSPVEKVGVIADLEVSLALLEDFGKANYRLPIPFTFDWRDVRLLYIGRLRAMAHPNIPAGRRATVSRPSTPLAAMTSSSAFALDSL